MRHRLYSEGDKLRVIPAAKKNNGGHLATLVGQILFVAAVRAAPTIAYSSDVHPQWLKVRTPDGTVTDWVSGDWFVPVKK